MYLARNTVTEVPESVVLRVPFLSSLTLPSHIIRHPNRLYIYHHLYQLVHHSTLSFRPLLRPMAAKHKNNTLPYGRRTRPVRGIGALVPTPVPTAAGGKETRNKNRTFRSYHHRSYRRSHQENENYGLGRLLFSCRATRTMF